MGLTKGVENPVMLCFPLQNSSCIKGLRSDVEYILLYAILLVVSSLTVFLNLLVIISVLHFKQLHTPTNLLILSLAVADFLMGLVVIPVDGRTFIETCWYFGDFLCTVFPVVMYTIFSGSLTNIFLISLDRYIAVMDPLQYKVRVTNKKVVLSVLLGWLYAFIYALVILNKHLQHPKPRSQCRGKCPIIIPYNYIVIDFIFAVAGPICIISGVYMRICCVARRQAKAMNTVTVRLRSVSKAIVPQKSETKAAKTLGGLIAIYFLCWTPYFVVSLTAETLPYNPAVLHVIYWLLYINSCINPLMYALFYPWFRISVKHILTLSILHSSSSYLNVVPHRQ
ncbi:hypothetical protein ACEWY4_009195 [Coilia grayii]|uniref:G-protein coupled receptors family 1 profile domain-containing protein n=1 Tax=Coilia grayii TaxID=363190 RepID=A0ABD1K5R8_9TELE